MGMFISFVTACVCCLVVSCLVVWLFGAPL